MESFPQDLGYAARMLVKAPGFTLVAVLTLALGIGANSAMFSVLNAVLFQSIPFRDSSQVMVVSQKMKNGTINLFTTADYLAWKEQSADLANMGAFVGHTYNFSGEPLAERLPGSQVTREIFSVTGISYTQKRPPISRRPSVVPAIALVVKQHAAASHNAGADQTDSKQSEQR